MIHIDPEVLSNIITGTISIVTGSWVGYFFTRKKYNSEVDLNLIEKMQRSLEFYMKLSEDNKRILEETLGKLEESQRRNDNWERKNEALEAEIKELRSQMFTLMTQICTDLSCSARKAYTEKSKKANKAKKTEE